MIKTLNPECVSSHGNKFPKNLDFGDFKVMFLLENHPLRRINNNWNILFHVAVDLLEKYQKGLIKAFALKLES